MSAGAAHVTTQRLRFCDTDQLGHVNNAVYAVMLEAGRSELVEATGLLDARAGRGVVLVRVEIDFLREMNWPGEVRIETEVARIGGKSVHLRQRLSVDGQLTARGLSVIAVIDTHTRRAVPIEPGWAERLGAWSVDTATV